VINVCFFELAVVFAQARSYRGGTEYSVPYDSTNGVPGYVFLGIWILILVFTARLAWEYRDKIFPKKDED
jgi:hypothetical protein